MGIEQIINSCMMTHNDLNGGFMKIYPIWYASVNGDRYMGIYPTRIEAQRAYPSLKIVEVSICPRRCPYGPSDEYYDGFREGLERGTKSNYSKKKGA